jgi:isoleucyl-tRNA synthetase
LVQSWSGRSARRKPRYQNGFDCQGLWIEVGVEKELGLNSKREIEEYGLAEFARKCRAVVEWSSSELIKGSDLWKSVSRTYCDVRFHFDHDSE